MRQHTLHHFIALCAAFLHFWTPPPIRQGPYYHLKLLISAASCCGTARPNPACRVSTPISHLPTLENAYCFIFITFCPVWSLFVPFDHFTLRIGPASRHVPTCGDTYVHLPILYNTFLGFFFFILPVFKLIYFLPFIMINKFMLINN